VNEVKLSERDKNSDDASRERDPNGSAGPADETVVHRDEGDEGRSGDTGIDSECTRYELSDPLGEGGMAVVYKATDRGLERTIAVKCLRDELASKDEMRQRFFDEARILGALGHPGAIPIHQAGRLPDGRFYYSMKKIEGRTLQDLLAERSPEQIRDRHRMLHFVDLFARVCETMAAAHAERVIHRDLKPENMMVDEFGAVYVMDWGLAKRLDADGSAEDSGRTRVGDVMGTPSYMSPEQASGQSLRSDCQSDVFSLGVILYEILTGVNPFSASSAQHAMKGVLYHDPDDPRSRNPKIDRGLSAVCMKALHKDPYRRYPTAGELLEDIRRFRRFQPVSAYTPRWIDRVYYWSRRQPALAAAAGTLAVLSSMVGFGMGLQAVIEHQTLRQAYGDIRAVLDAVDELEVELREVDDRLSDPALADEERRVLLARRRVLKDLMAVERGAVFGATWALETTFDESKGRARALGRDDYLKMIRRAVAEENWLRAHALLSITLSRVGEGGGHLFTPEDIAWIKEQHARVQAEVRKAGLESALEGIEFLEWMYK
jgi:serine/threonine protein kinase